MKDATRLLAEKIATDLFTDGNGNHADRLAMKHIIQKSAWEVAHNEREGSGWCEAAVADRVETILRENASTK